MEALILDRGRHCTAHPHQGGIEFEQLCGFFQRQHFANRPLQSVGGFRDLEFHAIASRLMRRRIALRSVAAICLLKLEMNKLSFACPQQVSDIFVMEIPEHSLSALMADQHRAQFYGYLLELVDAGEPVSIKRTDGSLIAPTSMESTVRILHDHYGYTP